MMSTRKYCSAQDLGGFEKVSAEGVSRKAEGSKGDGTLTGNGFLAYQENIKFAVRVSTGI